MSTFEILTISRKHGFTRENLEVNREHGAHGTLEVKYLDVLPSTLEKRDQKVDGQLDVTTELIFSHSHVADGKIHAKHFLHLVFDCACDLIDVVQRIIGRRNTGGKLSLAIETRQKTGNTLNQSVRSHESVVLVGDLLEFSLFLLESLELVLRDVRESFVTSLLTHFDVFGVSDNTDLGAGLGGKGQSVCATETLVLGWVEIFNGDLQLDGLREVADLSRAFLAIVRDLLTFGIGEHIPHGIFQNFGVNLRHTEI